MNKCILVLSLVAWAATAQGQANETVQALMDEPVSQLDFGMYRFESELREFRFNNLELFRDNSAQVRYNRDTARIEAEVRIYPESSSFKPEPQGTDWSRICRNGLNQIKNHFLNQNDTGPSAIAALFMTAGAGSREVPESWDSDLAGSVEIEVAVVSGRKNLPPLQVKKRFKSGLLDDEIQLLQ